MFSRRLARCWLSFSSLIYFFSELSELFPLCIFNDCLLLAVNLRQQYIDLHSIAASFVLLPSGCCSLHLPVPSSNTCFFFISTSCSVFSFFLHMLWSFILTWFTFFTMKITWWSRCKFILHSIQVLCPHGFSQKKFRDEDGWWGHEFVGGLDSNTAPPES